jgi:hypothetical protein
VTGVQRSSLYNQQSSKGHLATQTWVVQSWKRCVRARKCVRVLRTTNHFESITLTTVKSPWCWHQGSAETCRRSFCVSVVCILQCAEGCLYIRTALLAGLRCYVHCWKGKNGSEMSDSSRCRAQKYPEPGSKSHFSIRRHGRRCAVPSSPWHSTATQESRICNRSTARTSNPTLVSPQFGSHRHFW